MSDKIFILVLNYNNKNDSLKCLKLLKRLGIADVLFIDNGSTDNSLKVIKRTYPNLEVIENKKNLGFAAGNNVGIRDALSRGATKILLLNNDTQFSGENLKKLLRTNKDIVGPVLKFYRSGKVLYDLGGHINWFVGRATHKEVRSRAEICSTNPDYVSGAAILIKREVFEKVGLLDEDYFLYYEDADFCARACRAGFNVALESNAIIYHRLGASGGYLSRVSIFHNLRSNILFIHKNLPIWKRPIGLIYWSLLCIKVILNCLKK